MANYSTEPTPAMPAQQSVPAVHVQFSPPAVPLQTSIDNETLYIQGIVISTAQAQASVNAGISAQEVGERIYRDQLEYTSSTYASAKQCEASKYSADRQLEAERLRLTTVNPTEIQIRAQENAYRVQAAQIGRDGQIQAANIGAAADNTATQYRYLAELYNADQRHIEVLDGNEKDYQSKVFSASANKEASVIGSNLDLEGRKYASDQSYAAQIYDADKQFAGVQFHEQQETARLTTKLNYADGKFNLVYPLVEQSITDSQTASTPGLSTDLPFISTRGVFTAAQIQQQVNQAWAKNDSRTQSQILQTQRELAGRGFSSNSPMLEAMKIGYLGQNLRANTDAATGIRLQAAQANADQVLKGQELRLKLFSDQQQVALESEKNQVSRQVGLVGALSSLIGGLT